MVKFCAAELMFGLVGLWLRLGLGIVGWMVLGWVFFFFTILSVLLIPGCIPKIRFYCAYYFSLFELLVHDNNENNGCNSKNLEQSCCQHWLNRKATRKATARVSGGAQAHPQCWL